MAQAMKDWNAPGIGVGIVVNDKLVFARGYGFRDYGSKLPYTPTTTQPIASNTKLFTAVALGLLVEEGKLRWDEPIKRFVPAIRFYNDDLDRSVTIRDMLSHRTGVTRHDAIWYKSTFTRRELWDRLRYLEPAAPIRTTFLYNNLMYTAAGQVVEELSGLTWETFVQRRIFDPLGMSRSTLSIDDNLKGPEPAVPYSERRDSTELYRQPYYTAEVAIAPAGAINSSVQDLSRWVIALLNGGAVDGKPVIPNAVIRETMSPALAMPNAALESRGWGENLNQVYGMGRWVSSYRGHLLALHGGDLPGRCVHPQSGLCSYFSQRLCAGNNLLPVVAGQSVSNLCERRRKNLRWRRRRIRGRSKSRRHVFDPSVFTAFFFGKSAGRIYRTIGPISMRIGV